MKLKDHSLFPIHIGSDDRLALFSRGNRPKILQGLPIYIASKSENHSSLSQGMIFCF